MIRERAPRFVLFAARGSSDHAAIYAKYLTEILLQLPAGLVSASTTTLYGAEPDLRDVLLITVSQSGGSPDLLEVTASARRRGRPDRGRHQHRLDSPLNAAAELSVDVSAGVEHAVAATKTYSATLLALYLLIDAVRGGNGEAAASLGELAQVTLDQSTPTVEEAVRRYRFVDRVLTTGRGYSYATALEASLKLAETSYLAARAYSGADLLHGPVAAVDGETAVLAVTSIGKGGDSLRDALDVVHSARRRRRGRGLGSLGKVPSSLSIAIPETAEEVAPILEILPVQRLAHGLALARGGDPDAPRGLNKVTRTL